MNVSIRNWGDNQLIYKILDKLIEIFEKTNNSCTAHWSYENLASNNKNKFFLRETNVIEWYEHVRVCLLSRLLLKYKRD